MAQSENRNFQEGINDSLVGVGSRYLCIKLNDWQICTPTMKLKIFAICSKTICRDNPVFRLLYQREIFAVYIRAVGERITFCFKILNKV